MNFTKPLTMPRGSHYGSNYWEVYSSKMKRKACFFSDLEYANFLSLEMNPKIISMCEQPLEISVTIDGKLCKSIFDFWVKYENGTNEFQEIKYSSSLVDESDESKRTRLQIQKQKLWCEENNVSYVVRTEKDIYLGEYTYTNLSTMAARVRRIYNNSSEFDSYTVQLVNYIETGERFTIQDLINSGRLPLGVELSFLCYMHYLGKIKIDIDDRPLDSKSEVTLYGQ